MEFLETDISDVIRIVPTSIGDSRGFFSETFRLDKLSNALGFTPNFVQENHSLTRDKHVVRGLHFQAPPRAQAKLVRCVRGRIWDVVVDIRPSSPTYKTFAGFELTEANGHQLWVPEGCLHGFVTLTENCEIIYKVTDYYSKDHDRSVYYADLDLSVDWTVNVELEKLSEKDRIAPSFAKLDNPF